MKRMLAFLITLAPLLLLLHTAPLTAAPPRPAGHW